MKETEPEIIFEDKQLIILNKPAGLMTEEDKFNNPSAIGWVTSYLKSKQRGEIFVANVHRLDRPASGILMCAKKKSALKMLSEQFQKRQVEKIYYAITGLPPSSPKGHLVHWLYKDVKAKKALVFDHEKKDADRIELFYEIVSSGNEKYLWKIKLITGKYHQIRAQLAHINCPIAGDEKYGSFFKIPENKICLHAGSLTFTHPVENTIMEIKAPFPKFDPWTSFDEKL